MSDKTKETFWSRNFGLIEESCDKDGLYDGRICPSTQATFLYWMSWWGFATGIIGIWKGYPWLGAGVCVGSIFAQMYWLDPTFSWRRTLDMTWVQLLIWSHLWVALGSSQLITYVIIQVIGAICYGISWYFTKIGESWSAAIAHVAIHACANISLLILYFS